MPNILYNVFMFINFLSNTKKSYIWLFVPNALQRMYTEQESRLAVSQWPNYSYWNFASHMEPGNASTCKTMLGVIIDKNVHRCIERYILKPVSTNEILRARRLKMLLLKKVH